MKKTNKDARRGKNVSDKNMSAVEYKTEECPVTESDTTERQFSEIMRLMNVFSSAMDKMSAGIDSLSEKVVLAEKRNAELSARVEKLQDRMFSLGMAEVTVDGNTRHESYHNLILDEVCALREDVDVLKNEVRCDSEKLTGLEKNGAEIGSLSVSMKDILNSLDDIKTKLELTELKKDDPDTAAAEESKDRLSQSIDELKKELSKIAEDFSAE